MRSAIVTGGEGFIGRHLVQALRRRGVTVTTLGRKQSTEPTHIVVQPGSWNSPALDRAIEEAAPDCIFHLAGTTRGSIVELAEANVALMHGLLSVVGRRTWRPRLVIAGSAAEYGAAIEDGEPVCETAICAPRSAYGASKLAQTRAALDFADATGASVVVARIFNPLGSGMPAHLAFGDFAAQIAAMPHDRGLLKVGNINVRRDILDVKHVATMLCQLAENMDATEIINICSGEAPLMRDLVEMLIDASGREIRIEVDWARVRGNELRVIVGSTGRLAKFGCPPPPTDFPAVLSRLCRDMEAAYSERQRQPGVQS